MDKYFVVKVLALLLAILSFWHYEARAPEGMEDQFTTTPKDTGSN